MTEQTEYALDLTKQPTELRSVTVSGLVETFQLRVSDVSGEFNLRLVGLGNIGLEQSTVDRSLLGPSGRISLPRSWHNRSVRVRIELLER